MARTTGSTGIRTEHAIREAALDLIARHGFAAMTLRQLAEAVGLQAGSIYRYFPSKNRLLVDLMVEHLEALIAQWEVARPVEADAVARLRAFVAFHIRSHTLRRREAFVSNMELRSLEPADHRRVVGLRRRYEALLTGVLQDGIDAGEFQLPDAKVATYAILALLTGVGSWYREGGRLNQRQLVDQYTQLVLQCAAVVTTEPA